MSAVVNLSRREFLRGAAAVGGLTLGVELWKPAQAAATKPFQPNAFVRISPDDSIVIIIGRSEMGQGVYTSLPMLLAEELDADWQRIRIEAAPASTQYDNPWFKMQLTGGSSSVASSWEQLRMAGATARAMLVAAAAEQWRVSPESCRTQAGLVIHEPSRQRLSYGALAEAASHRSIPTDVNLKERTDFNLIGKPIERLDLADKGNGRAIYGIDIAKPGMLTAVVARPPQFGARLRSIDDKAALATPGVRHVVRIDAGVAVVGDDTWSAIKGRDALVLDWDEGALAGFGDARQHSQYAELLEASGAVADEAGDAATAMRDAASRVESRYEFPYLAHTTMEPLNCVADVRADRCEIWVGTQFQSQDRSVAANAAGLRVDQVELHTCLLGGGFGRRGVPDGHFVKEAVQVSRAVRAPVKVVWTRSDDIRGGYYRPVYRHLLRGGLDAAGQLTAWSHRVVGQSVLAGTPFMSGNIDRSSIHVPFYRLPHRRIELHTVQLPIPVWAWRSVGATHNAFVVECFIDELAFAAGKDPVEFRRPLLEPRYRAVLDLVAEKSGWGSPLPAGRGRGVAIHQFDSIVAQVAEVSVSEGVLRVHRIVCAVDCGTAVNPDTVSAQMEGGIAMALSAALHEQLNFKDGRVVQSNFADYPILRLNEMPRIEVHILESHERPAGVGEAGVPPTAPAVANAIFAATGRRLRRLPLRMAG